MPTNGESASVSNCFVDVAQSRTCSDNIWVIAVVQYRAPSDPLARRTGTGIRLPRAIHAGETYCQRDTLAMVEVHSALRGWPDPQDGFSMSARSVS